MTPILDSLTAAGIDDIVVYDNSKREDLAVYGRYAAIAEAKHDLIYVQDDDCIVSDPTAIIQRALLNADVSEHGTAVVCNMPPEFRAQEFYREHALVGFGGCFRRDAPFVAFGKFWEADAEQWLYHPLAGFKYAESPKREFFLRRADVAFTTLTPRVLVDVPVKNLPYYDAPNRSWKQKNHFGERKRMLELALKVREA